MSNLFKLYSVALRGFQLSSVDGFQLLTELVRVLTRPVINHMCAGDIRAMKESKVAVFIKLQCLAQNERLETTITAIIRTVSC